MVRIAVVGCGLLGVSIAGELAYCGHTVHVYDKSSEILDSVPEQMRLAKKELRAEGLMPHVDFIGRIFCHSILEEAVVEADFVFEAIVENLQAKQDILQRISLSCSSTAVIGSSALRLPVDEIFKHVVKRERCLGVRFLYPVFCIPEVELTLSRDTSTRTIETIRQFMEKMGKTCFLRSGPEPVILTEEEKEARKKMRLHQIKVHRGLSNFGKNFIPELAHCGNFAPPQDNKLVHSGVTHWASRECAICLDGKRNAVLNPCHHICTCLDCAKLLLSRRDSCPICRKPIQDTYKVYYA